MVRKAGTGTLSLAEVEVRGVRPNGSVNTASNLSRNKPASQSTTAFGGVASRAVDGNTNGIYFDNSVSHTALDFPSPWWRVDMGAIYDVGRINIINREDCCPERLDGAVLYIGNTPSNNPADYTVVATLNSELVQQFTSATLGTNASTNAVAAQTAGNGIAVGSDIPLASSADFDRDNDGVPAYIDDNDFDGRVADDNNAVEAFFDPDGDGALSLVASAEEALDTDGDFVPDNVEVSEGTDPTDPQSYSDFDEDELPDYVDTDDDNDGIPDFIEGDADMDNDGLSNRFDLDSDGDGVSDAAEGVADVDGNSVPNFLDSSTTSATPNIDQDNDGIDDDLEGMGDFDSDGVPNLLDEDSDGDFISDMDETNADLDADGIPNFLDLDSDGDSISDLAEGDADTDGDGVPDYLDAQISTRSISAAASGCSIGGSKNADFFLLLMFVVAGLMLRRRRSLVRL